jgi:hypothetical protein
METLVSGTIETLVIKVVDRKGALTDLSVVTPLYDVLDKDDVYKMTSQAVNADGLKAYCLIDTTAGGNWASGIYRLYLKFSTAPEVPVHGPFPFRVEVR